MTNKTYCCIKLAEALDHKVHPLMYEQETDEYYVAIHYSPLAQIISFCPWCATQLGPQQTILKRVQKKLPINSDITLLPYLQEHFPPFMQEDAWWRQYEHYHPPYAPEKNIP